MLYNFYFQSPGVRTFYATLPSLDGFGVLWSFCRWRNRLLNLSGLTYPFWVALLLLLLMERKNPLVISGVPFYTFSVTRVHGKNWYGGKIVCKSIQITFMRKITLYCTLHVQFHYTQKKSCIHRGSNPEVESGEDSALARMAIGTKKIKFTPRQPNHTNTFDWEFFNWMFLIYQSYFSKYYFSTFI